MKYLTLLFSIVIASQAFAINSKDLWKFVAENTTLDEGRLSVQVFYQQKAREIIKIITLAKDGTLTRSPKGDGITFIGYTGGGFSVSCMDATKTERCIVIPYEWVLDDFEPAMGKHLKK